MNNLFLGIVSIILIICIATLILYKNNKDNTTDKTTDNTTNIFEYFDVLTPDENTIIANNSDINNLITQLSTLTSNIPNNIAFDSSNVDYDFQTNLYNSINSNVSTLVSEYSTNNNMNQTKLDDLENKVSDLENIINNKKMKNLNEIKYNRVKSFNNGMEMNLINTPNTLFQDVNTGKITDTYLVGVNNGCLSVGANDYDIYKCNDKNSKQQFKMHHIINETDYANNIDKSLPFDNIDKSSISYPFAMIKSVNNNNCLTNNHGSLTVQPCYSFIAQRWMPI